MRAITDRYRLTYLRFSCSNTIEQPSPLGIRRSAGVRPRLNPYLSATASRDAGSFNLPGSKSRPSLLRGQKLTQHSWNHSARGFSAMTESVSSLFSMPSWVSTPPVPTGIFHAGARLSRVLLRPRLSGVSTRTHAFRRVCPYTSSVMLCPMPALIRHEPIYSGYINQAPAEGVRFGGVACSGRPASLGSFAGRRRGLGPPSGTSSQ